MVDGENVIEFDAAVRQVKTLVDGGLVFIFDAPEGSIAQAAQLMTAKKMGIYLNVQCRASGFAKKQAEEEVLNHDQKILRLQKQIDEREDDLFDTNDTQ
jgi:hypothetical protein